MERTVIPLEQVLIAYSRASQFEAEHHGEDYPLREEFFFLPKTTGFDVRCPTLPIRRYARLYHGTIIGPEDVIREENKPNVTEVIEEEGDEVFYPTETDLERNR